MRIALNAHLLSGQAGYRSAGIHHYIENMLRHLPAAAPDAWHLTAFVGAAYSGYFERVEMRRSRWDTGSPLRRILWEQFAQPVQIARYDLHHGLAFVLPAALTVPAVVTIYDLSFIHYPDRLPAARRLYLRLFTRISARRARRVIAISRSTARDVQETLGIAAEKIDVAAPGFDHARFRPLPAAEIEAFRTARSLPQRFWLFIGTLEPRKNLLTLIEAYARLSAAERLPLIIGGAKGWDYAPIFEAVERYSLGDQVRFEGFIPSEDLVFWYNCAEAFIYPSVFEGFGLPVLEATACGTPVVISDASSLPEAAAETSLKVPPHDVEAWRDALRRAAGDAEWRAEQRARGTQEAQRYHWALTAQATVASYRKALHNGV